ncbi:hypothetical protein AAFF_G00368080 [Aldrovandia affinis]|uniref:Uncharacterized protein n=1 Tax=Aldrovandia affinis TaxID=143900 RepID=A0AAD7R511_9TELE|nr:hypothetical protein AAFF_G00368080 [Aldrovandia affinis]
MVARGTDIPTAKALYDTLLPLTKVKLLYVEEDQINRVSTLLPKELTTIKVDDVTKDLVGKWCVITYDDDPYPGIIEDIEEGALEVKVMHNIGRNDD